MLSYIQTHLTGNLSLAALEKKFFLNRYSLCRLFKRATGSTLQAYIRTKRLALAQQFLAEGKGVAIAAQASGFNDYTNFLKAFKEKTGVLPREYGKRP